MSGYQVWYPLFLFYKGSGMRDIIRFITCFVVILLGPIRPIDGKPVTNPGCKAIPKNIKLAAYINKYPYSTLHPDRVSYSTTSGLSLAWRDIQVEDKMAKRYLDTYGDDTTATQLRVLADENAAIALLEWNLFPEREPTLPELKDFYQKTSPTLTEPASAQLNYYFLRRANDNSTSKPLVKLIAKIDENCKTKSDFFKLASRGDLPSDVTTGSAKVMRGKLNPNIENQAFSLPLFRRVLFSGDHGWYIFCVTNRQDKTSVLSFDETSDTLRKKYESAGVAIKKQQIEQYVKQVYSVSYLNKDREDIFSPGENDTVLFKVGETEVKKSEFAAFAKSEHQDIYVTDHTVLEKLMQDYVLRIRLVQFSIDEGYTSGCRYQLEREFDFNKALATQWLNEVTTVSEPTQGEIRELYKQVGSEMKIGPQYGVVDIWTTGPTNNRADPDEAFLQHEAVLTRMNALRTALDANGIKRELLADLDKKYGPFVIQDRGTSPQGPRGYLLDTAVEKLAINNFSPVVHDDNYYHFYMLTEKIPARQMTFKEASLRLVNTIRSNKRGTARKKLIESFALDLEPFPTALSKLLDEDYRDTVIEKLNN